MTPASDVITNTLVVSVIENASAAGYYVLTNIIRNTQDEEAVKGVKEIFYQRRINGGVFIGAASHEPLIEELVQDGFVVAVVIQELPDRNELNRIVVNFDNELGMQQAVDYLVSLNHQEIGVINGDMLRQSGPSKYDGYVKAMKNHGLKFIRNGFSRETLMKTAAIRQQSALSIAAAAGRLRLLRQMTAQRSER